MRIATLFLMAACVLAGCGGASASSSTVAGEAPSGAGALRALRERAGAFLDGGPAAFTSRLRGLNGHPVVVNEWASWCGPCRYEFPFFAVLADKYNGRIAFIGVDSKDSKADARAFVGDHAVPYPHFWDPDGDIARLFRGGRAFPTTAFYDSAGKLTQTHYGGYPSQAKLDADIRRYALHG